MRFLARRKKATIEAGSQPSAANAYPIRAALELTIQTLGRRGRGYRFLVIAVVVIIILITIACLIAGSVRPLAGLLYLVLACSLYFCWDASVLTQWRTALFASWSALQIDFAALRQGLSMNAALPQLAVAGMLDTLPFAADAGTERKLTVPTRVALQSTVLAIHACRSDGLVLHCIAHALVATAVVVAVGVHRWSPLLAGASIVLLLLSRRIATRRRVNALSSRLQSLRQQPDFDAQGYVQLATGLDWSPIPSQQKLRLLGE